MKDFSEIYERALKRKGGEENLALLMPEKMAAKATLKKMGDDRYLAQMTMCVFKAGFVWKVIDNKWGNFEKAFWAFNIRRCGAMSPDDEDALLKNAGIVRNARKIQSVQRNAVFISDVSQEYGSFGGMMASWPREDFIGLLNLLHKRGDRLGWQSAQYFCRFVGKDGFVLSNDVVAALVNAGVVDKAPTSKAAQAKVQAAFNQWRDESGLGLAQVSRVLALSIDAP